MSDSPPQSAPPTVYFDGDCPVCSREIAVYQRLPGAESVCWVNAAACDDGAFGPGLTRDAALVRLHVRRADGSLVGGAAAFIAIWAALPRTARLARWLNHRPVVALLDAAYNAFLVVRRTWRRAS
ncbi:DCC1-like thiol-disulfide oxidoreductase family protein [Roseateles sp. DC23W]|uniref:DCC1-like thiol-disulfide oxidoreductase family protein n=1 Tax=Pelomonas dachongensis TaxID=3299029 RepID=A0ABW7ESA3_9BURK